MIPSSPLALPARLVGPLAAAFALAIAFALALVGTVVLYPPGYSGTGWLWYLAATAFAAFAFAVLQRREGERLPACRPAGYVSPARVGVALLLMLGGLVLAVVAIAGLAQGGAHEFLRWLWLAGIVLLVAGSLALGAVGPRPGTGILALDQPRDRRQVYLELAGFALLMGLAVFMRVYRLRQMPPGIFVDETNAALDAVRIMEGRPDSPFGTGWFETPSLYAFYLVALFRSLGTTFVALKAASLIPAVLTVAAIYPLARLLFGIPTAFAATFILATSRWHITMSRWGWNEVAPLLFMIAAAFFLMRGFRDRRASDFALGGLFLGLGHYTYLASRLVVLAVACYLLYRILFERGFLRRYWRGLVVFLVLYLVTLGPLAVSYARDPFTFTNRSQQVSILNDMQAFYMQQREPAPRVVGTVLRAVGLPKEVSLLPLQESILRHLEMFHVAGDRNPRHNLPGAPMLDPVTGGLLALSLGFAVLQLLRPRGEDGRSGGQRYALLLLWLFVPLLGGMLTRLDEAPQAYRTLPVVGAVALLAGNAAALSVQVFASGLTEALPAAGARWTRAIPAMVIAGLLLWSGLYNYRLYFEVQAQDGRVWQAYSPVETTVATEVAAAMDQKNFYLTPRLYNFSPLKFLTYRSLAQGGGGLSTPAYQQAEPVTDLPLSDPFAQDAVFLLDAYYQDVPELFTVYYPETSFEMVEGPGGQPLYLSVTVPGADIAALQGMRALYEPSAGQPAVERAYLDAPRFIWPPDLAPQADPASATARWQGSLHIPVSGIYSFELAGPGQLLLDGIPGPGAVFLGRGLHALDIVQSEPGSDVEIVLSWLRPGRDGAEPVPPSQFFQVAPPISGLRGEYYAGELWEGEPAFARVDPLLMFAWPEAEPWPAPFSVRWTGTLNVPDDGDYRFMLNADDGVRLWLDDQLIGEGMTPDTVNQIDVQVPLAAGLHPVRIDYYQRGGGKALEFWWQPPGDHLRPVPPGVLSPV